MERGCACTQGQRTCTARRAGAGVDKGLSAIPLRCHPERSDTLKGTRGSRASGKTLTFTDGPLHLRTGFFVACAPQNDRKRAALCGITPCTRVRPVGIPSASACRTGAAPRSSRLSAGDAFLPTRHFMELRLARVCGRVDIFFASLCRDMCGAHARHSSLRRYLPCSAARRFIPARRAAFLPGRR